MSDETEQPKCPDHGVALKSRDPNGDWTGDWYCDLCGWVLPIGWGYDG